MTGDQSTSEKGTDEPVPSTARAPQKPKQSVNVAPPATIMPDKPAPSTARAPQKPKQSVNVAPPATIMPDKPVPSTARASHKIEQPTQTPPHPTQTPSHPTQTPSHSKQTPSHPKQTPSHPTQTKVIAKKKRSASPPAATTMQMNRQTPVRTGAMRTGAVKTNNPFELVNSEMPSMAKIMQLESESPAVAEGDADKPTISARLIMIKEPDLVVDLGGKAEGYCLISEFSKMPKVGEVFHVVITNREKDGSIRVSYKAAERYSAWQDLIEKEAAGENILVTVHRKDNNGFIVLYKGVLELFLPGSHASKRYPSPLNMNREIPVSVLKLRKRKDDRIGESSKSFGKRRR